MTPTEIFWLVGAYIFCSAAAIGSFLNVVIYRVPIGQSVVSPPSHCPVCKTEIRWYNNLPILSWFLLRGKCGSCKTPYSFRYAFVEILTAVLACVVWYQSGGFLLGLDMLPDNFSWTAIIALTTLRFTFVVLLICITFIDLDHLIIPHRFTFFGMALGLAAPWIMRSILGPSYLEIWPPVTPFISIVGWVVGALTIFVIFYGYLAARGVEGMGGGDLTLLAMLGAWLGWPAICFILFASSLQGVVLFALAKVFKVDGFIRDSNDIFTEEEDGNESGGEKNSEAAEASEDDEMEGRAAIPFGPFLALAGWEFMFLGPYLPEELNMIQMYAF